MRPGQEIVLIFKGYIQIFGLPSVKEDGSVIYGSPGVPDGVLQQGHHGEEQQDVPSGNIVVGDFQER